MQDHGHDRAVRFEFDLDGVGWARATLSCDEWSAELTASYLSDALGGLLKAVRGLTLVECGTWCAWAGEPGEFRWMFKRTGDEVTLYVVRDDTDSVFLVTEPLRSLVQAFADGATDVRRRYGEAGYREQWVRHEFPVGTLDDLQSWLALE